MRFRRGGAALAAGLVLAGPAATVAADEQVTLTGTYRRMAVERPDGHVYDDLLVTQGRSYRLRLTAAQRPRPGDTVRVSASTTDVTSGSLRATRVTTVSGAKPLAVTGTTTTLAILAYWTAPDATTQAKAQSQLFGDDNNFVRENSYGSTSLSGTVTPWVRIQAPVDGRCYDYASQILSRARTAAAGLGYNVGGYHRTLVYFPRCTGSDTTNLTGWAYEPGDSIWLNGVMDRRTSVHEHGHSFGMGHARSYTCTSGGVRVTLGGSCAASEYGDPFDAMGQSGFVGHFSGPHKEDVGWLEGNRKRILTTSSATFTLPPFEKPATSPVVAVANSPVPGRRYWMEYRQPIGFDAKLPAGGTSGLMIHLEDQSIGLGPYLLDLSPSDGTIGHAVLTSGRSWTAPDGVRFSVGSVSSTGVTVTVSGARPEPVPPSAPRLVVAHQGDQRVRVTWEAPVSDGNGTISRYEIRATGGASQYVLPSDRDALFAGLQNDTAYTFYVTAVNEAGPGPEARASATPRESAPTVAITTPTPGSVVAGDVSLYATAAPGTDSLVAVSPVRWLVNGVYKASYAAETPYVWRTLEFGNGTHTVTATVTDDNRRTASHTTTFEVRNLKPTVAITSPSSGSAITGGVQTVTATAAPAEDGAAVTRVEFRRGDPYYSYLVHTDYTAPYEYPWDLSNASDGSYTLVAQAYDASGRSALSAPVQVQVRHASPTATITSPTASSVRGSSVTVTADAATGTPGVPISYVEFSFGGMYQADWSAPYSATFDTSDKTGYHTIGVAARETSGRVGYVARGILLDNPLPSVSVTSPAAYTSVRGKTLTIAGTAAPTSGGAPIARVDLVWSSRSASAVPAADGTWSATFDVTGVYGSHTVTAKAVDTAGLWRRTYSPFTLVRPVPAVTLVTPATGATLSTARPVDLVATVAPAADAVTTVRSVCFRLEYVRVGCGTVQEDGSYRLNGVMPTWPGTRTVAVLVAESDGYETEYATTTVSVMGAPIAPSYAVAWEFEDATVGVQWQPSWQNDYQPVAEYVVRNEEGDVLARTTGDTVRIRPADPGHPQRFTVEAVNAHGASGRSWTDTVIPNWSTHFVNVSVSRPSVTYLDYVTVKAQLARWDGTPVPGALVELDGFTPFGEIVGSGKTFTTSSTGWVSVTFRPEQTLDHWFRFPGDGIHGSAMGGGNRVVVHNRVTGTLTRTAMTLGTTTWFNGRVYPAVRARTVHLQRYYNGAWRPVTSKGQNIDGTVAFPIKPTARGTYTYRLYYPADGLRSAGYSPSRTVTVS